MDGNLLLTLLDAAGFACSSGSACKTGNPEPSEVMAAIDCRRSGAGFFAGHAREGFDRRTS